MDHYFGINASLEQSGVCLVDVIGRIVRKAKVASESEALAAFLIGPTMPLVWVGLEAGPLPQWFNADLTGARYGMVLVETRHVKAARAIAALSSCHSNPSTAFVRGSSEAIVRIMARMAFRSSGVGSS